VGQGDAYLVVYSMTDPKSFRYAVEVTCELRRRRLRVSSAATSSNDTSVFDNSELVSDSPSKSHIANSVPSMSSSRSPVIIMVANKSDLVRTRQVSKTGRCMFDVKLYHSVYASISVVKLDVIFAYFV